MPFTFDRPIGAGADVSELEFVSALMQTNLNEMRTDGSITGRFHEILGLKKFFEEF